MNLGIDARLLHDTTGIGRYTRSLFLSYLHQKRFLQDHLFLFSDRDITPFPVHDHTSATLLQEQSDRIHLVTAAYTRRIIWTNWHVPPRLREQKIDVYHGVCNFELPVRKMCRYVVTIHDLVPLFFPRLVPKKHLLFFKMFIQPAARTADRIITDSQHSKADIIEHLRVSEDKIRVISLGYDPPPVRSYDGETVRDTLARYGIKQPYLLFVGVIEPKKNLERLLEAFALLRREKAIGNEVSLVLAGGKGWFCEQLDHTVARLHLKQHVIFTGFVPDDELALLYRHAELFVFPSIYEGFGLPVLEAMAAGVPVVTSNVSSLPEIAGDAGRLVNPYAASDIAEGIAAVFGDETLRAEMREAGQRQAQRFSWARTADDTYKVYQEAYSFS